MQNELLHWLLIHYGHENMRPGLDRIREGIIELIPKFKNTKIITVAGTNGKGETTLRLSELLKDHRHFVWTSPHIERLTERFRSETGEIDISELKSIIDECHIKVQEKKLDLSFYEFLFLVFCTWAARSSPKFLLLEVGLGGRLDAVNVFDADVVLIPSISRDHQEILGRRYDQILLEKLGTLRKNSLCIHFLHGHYLTEITERVAKSIGAKVIALKNLSDLPEYEFSLRNRTLAYAAYCHLTNKNFEPSILPLSVNSLEHRGESVFLEKKWLFFGSHNVDGMRKLIQFLHSGTYNFSRPPYDLVIVAFSKRNSGDLRLMMRMLKNSGLGKILITTFDHPKAEKAQIVEGLSQEEGLEFVQNIDVHVQGKNKNQRVLVTGSYYFMGHIKSLVR
jgi:dihydrofolate synthase / folylpolyglutamate synthase